MKRLFNRPTTLDDLIERAVVALAKHPLLTDPPVLYDDGSPARIVKFRNFSGVELQESQLTLSLFPYHYDGPSGPTPESRNVSMSFRAYNQSGPDPRQPGDALEVATAFVKVRLAVRGFAQSAVDQGKTATTVTGPFGIPLQLQTFETSQFERVLRQWMEYLRAILITDLFNLEGFVKSSQVNWVNFPTTQWDKGASSILHVADLLWELTYFPLRDYKQGGITRNQDELIGSLQADGAPVWYLPKHDVLMTGFGRVILNTPKGIPITWGADPTDPAQVRKTFLHAQTRQPLSEDALLVKGTPFINRDVMPIGVLTAGSVLLYHDRRTDTIITREGTTIAQLPVGKTIAWDPVNKILVYGDREGPLARTPVDPGDLVDPKTGDLYLNTFGLVTAMNFASNPSRPAIREFLSFSP